MPMARAAPLDRGDLRRPRAAGGRGFRTQGQATAAADALAGFERVAGDLPDGAVGVGRDRLAFGGAIRRRRGATGRLSLGLRFSGD